MDKDKHTYLLDPGVCRVHRCEEEQAAHTGQHEAAARGQHSRAFIQCT